MTAPNINFRDIRPHEGSQNRAFEELCFQLLPTLEILPTGTRCTRHGTPDAGVEVTAQLPNGQVWGWQAKFFFTFEDSQFSQMDRSVRSALAAHPDLTRYVLWFPENLPSGHIPGKKSAQSRWNEHVTKWHGWAQAEGTQVSFEYVGSSTLLKALVECGNPGLAWYWFDQTMLSPEWFQGALEQAIADAGPRYTPELNVDLPIASVFDGLGRRDAFQVKLKLALREIREKRRYTTPRRFADGEDDPPEEFVRLFAAATEALDTVDRAVSAIDVTSVDAIPFGDIVEMTRAATKALEAAWQWAHGHARAIRDRADPHGEEGTGARRADDRASRAESTAWELNRISLALEELRELLLSPAAALVNLPVLLLVGEAGTGKTHLLCDVAAQRLRAHQPTVLLLGQWFADGDPWRQLLDKLGLACEVDDFLGALESAAELNDSRALIFIDGINEGRGVHLWPAQLASFVQRLRRWPRLGLAVSCRTSYLDATVPDSLWSPQGAVTVSHEGFRGQEYKAVRSFFAYHKLTLPDFPLLVPEFQSPLFLKLMCKGLEALGYTTLPRGATGLTWLFEQFLASANKQLADRTRCDFDPLSPFVTNAARRLAEAMLEDGREWVPFPRAQELVDSLLPHRGWTQSLFAGLLSEGVLTRDHVWEANRAKVDAIAFSYQRFGDHLRATVLCERAGSQGIIEECRRLATDSSAAWRNAGLLEALAVLVPERFQVEVHDLVPDPSFEQVCKAYLKSLMWRDSKAFPDEPSLAYLNQIAAWWGGDDNSVVATFLEVACLPGHPFNATFLHKNLWGRSLANRDLWWSSFVHMNYVDDGYASRLIDWALSEDTSYCANDSVLLCATTLTWFLTSSNRFLRDRSTKALVSLLRSRPSVVVELLERFDGVNDPYVAERLYAVAYGCTMMSVAAETIRPVADVVYRLVFADGEPPVHVLLRDYARGVLERAQVLGFLPENIDMAKARPPYASPWPITAPSEASLRKRYHDTRRDYFTLWGSVFDWGDFHRYVLETSLRHFLAPGQDAKRAQVKKQRAQRFEEAWGKFMASLTARQTRSLNKLLSAKRALDRFHASLTEQQAALFRVAIGTHPSKWNKQEYIAFDVNLAARWIFSRVLRLGWTPERFSDIERYMQYSAGGRESHKAERIGKKYQWIALHELLARVADHCPLMPEWGRDDLTRLEGPGSLYRRDIDPSLLLLEASQGPNAPDFRWAVTDGVGIQWKETADAREAWLHSMEDMPSPEDLIEKRSREGVWWSLDTYLNWYEELPTEVPPYSAEQSRCWYSIRSYLIRSSDLDHWKEWAPGQEWRGPWVPEPRTLHQVFIGEYPWHPAAPDASFEWESFERAPDGPPVVVTTSHYYWEGNGFDCSIDETVNPRLLSPALLTGLRVRWSGSRFSYVDEEGSTVAFEVDANGVDQLWVSADALTRYLQEHGLSLVWTVLGEKQVIARDFAGRTSGWLEVCGSYALVGDNVTRLKLTSEYKPPYEARADAMHTVAVGAPVGSVGALSSSRKRSGRRRRSIAASYEPGK